MTGNKLVERVDAMIIVSAAVSAQLIVTALRDLALCRAMLTKGRTGAPQLRLVDVLLRTG
jgi:hypothetical protein